MPSNLTRAHILLLGEEKAGKTTWALEAAESGFNVLFLDGDVGGQRLADLSPAAQRRVFYMDVSDEMVGDLNPRMIETVAELFSSPRFMWNDTKQRLYSRSKDEHDPESGACLDEIWEFRPALFDDSWVLIIDSWTTLSYSAMVAKAIDSGVSLADVEKIERNLYSGVGNRLTNIAVTQQKAPCHTIVIGHPTQYEKRKSQDGKTVREALKENDMIVEWTKMIPKSSSNPHGFTLGKFFSDIGWLESDKFGKRKIDFTKTSTRTSGGNLNTKGDPKTDHRFEDLIRKIGGKVPGKDSDTPLGNGLTIHPAGTFIPATPATKKNVVIGSKSTASAPLEPKAATPTPVKGVGGLGALMQSK